MKSGLKSNLTNSAQCINFKKLGHFAIVEIFQNFVKNDLALWSLRLVGEIEPRTGRGRVKNTIIIQDFEPI